MSDLPNCPQCNSEYSYQDASQYVCPECAHEWSIEATGNDVEAALDGKQIHDSNGNLLQDGDTVTVIKDLKVKGIRLVDGDHDIDCKIPGVGAMKLKSQFVKKQ